MVAGQNQMSSMSILGSHWLKMKSCLRNYFRSNKEVVKIHTIFYFFIATVTNMFIIHSCLAGTRMKRMKHSSQGILLSLSPEG